MSFSATKPFDLPFLPTYQPFESDAITNSLLLQARTELAELKGYSIALPNPMLLLSPAILKEAVASSEIENINTTIERVLQQQLFPEYEQKIENKEVLRYKEAIVHGFNEMRKLPIGNRLINDIHKILLADRSGGYRKIQNHIENTDKKQIIYTPPSPQKIEDLIANWEIYIHNNDEPIDPLIKCAISHYQFEAIHPFNDGNGRTGRILMVLYLIQQNIINYPILYISGFITKNRSQYYKLLQGVTEQNDWKSFVDYMLHGFYLQAKETKEQLFKVMYLYYKKRDEIKEKCQSAYSSDLVELIFAMPVITPVKLGNLMNVHYTTATRYLKALHAAGFLDHQRVGKYQLYINKELINTLNGVAKINNDGG